MKKTADSHARIPWKAILVQVAVLVGIAVVLGLAARMAMLKIASQQTASGFGFLSNSAGFDISESVIAFESQMSYGRAILAGFINTLVCAAVAAAAATVLGLGMGLARLSTNFLLRNVTLGISEAIRNVPLLLQLLVWYALVINVFPVPREAEPLWGWWFTNRGVFIPAIKMPAESLSAWLLPILAAACALVYWKVAPRLINASLRVRKVLAILTVCAILGLLLAWAYGGEVSRPKLQGFNISGGISLSPEMAAMIIGLGVYSSAFIGEVIRSGVLAVPTGQVEAAYALGLTPLHRVRFIVLPQALRLVLPPLSNIYLSLGKNTSLGVAIGFPDLSSVIATTINQSGHAIEGVLIQVVAYLLMSFTVWFAISAYDKRTNYVLR